MGIEVGADGCRDEMKLNRLGLWLARLGVFWCVVGVGVGCFYGSDGGGFWCPIGHCQLCKVDAIANYITLVQRFYWFACMAICLNEFWFQAFSNIFTLQKNIKVVVPMIKIAINEKVTHPIIPSKYFHNIKGTFWKGQEITNL